MLEARLGGAVNIAADLNGGLVKYFRDGAEARVGLMVRDRSIAVLIAPDRLDSLFCGLS